MSDELTFSDLSNLEHFSADWYNENYPEAGILGLSAEEHFYRFGTRLGYGIGPHCTFSDILQSRIKLKLISDRLSELKIGISEPEANTCLVVTPLHTLGYATAIRNELRALGFLAEVDTSLDNQSQFQHIFVLCPNIFENLPLGFIAVQLEQSVSSRWFNDSYFEKLHKAAAIIDYSVENVEFLKARGLPFSKLYYAPPFAEFEDVVPVQVAKDIDILFYGDDKCPRRQQMLEIAQQRFNVTVVNNVFGQDVWQLIRRAKIVLNLHYYEGAQLEVVRIIESLALGARVVSETSSDLERCKSYEQLVDFFQVGDPDDMVRVLEVVLLASKQNGINEFEVADKVAQHKQDFRNYFRRFLYSLDFIGFDCANAFKGYSVKGDKFFLTLAETPSRATHFRNQGRIEFKQFEGLRHRVGWRGCGASFKSFMSHAKLKNIEKITICEDDVYFPPNYGQRIEIINEYLEKENENWDLFSGFIADVSDEYMIDRVEDFMGETFVWLNKSVSMVYNIYNKRAIDLIGEWNTNDCDAETNTVDRYLERSQIRVVTTYPFLVGHEEKLTSTLWGFENSSYNHLIDKSLIAIERLLFEWRSSEERSSRSL